MLEPDPSREAARLPALLSALNRARSAQAGHRGVNAQADASLSRIELLIALQSYVDALEGANRPVPYRLRDELRLRRAVSRAGSST